MYKLFLKEGYASKLTKKETQRAIKLIKDTFQVKLAKALNLDRVTAPLIVEKGTGINDDLSGVERPVAFDMKAIDGKTAEIVQSLAKWKRMALKKYHYEIGEGIYTDMNAIRRDDRVDNTHSIFVDQWDWEKVIARSDRTVEYLQDTVRKIVLAMWQALEEVKVIYPMIDTQLCPDVKFITTQELEDLYPQLTPSQRESEITREYKTVFIMQIGGALKSGSKHDDRAPDYDDWTLNGDIFVWDEVLGAGLELSSMGIRVDADVMKSQLQRCGNLDRLACTYHKAIMEDALPLTIGGGIGQSRLCMFMLQKLHIGEVQVSLWPQAMLDECAAASVKIL